MENDLNQLPENNSWQTYLLSLAFALLGFYILGGTAMGLLISSRVPVLNEQVEVADYFSMNEYFILNLVPFIIGFLLLVFAAKVFHKRSFLSFVTARTAFDFKRFGFSFFIWMFLLSVVFTIQWMQSPSMFKWNVNWSDFGMLALITIFLVPLQTGFEEVFFRGFLQQLLIKSVGKGILAILMNGILFGAIHSMNPEMDVLGWPAMVFYVLSGVFTALIALMDEGIELSWGFHFANNFFGILIVTTDWQALQTNALFVDTSPPAFGWDMIITLILMYPLMILVFSKVYKWKDWKKRLF
jgi:membrane protease YdiL (CAAX protease family)